MKAGISYPKTMEFCRKRIKHLEEKLASIGDKREMEGRAAALEIADRDKEILIMCRSCRWRLGR